jgi:hypothetical protein
MESEAARAVVEELREATAPVSLKALQKRLAVKRITPEVVAASLTTFVQNRTAYAWPKFRSVVRYWHQEPNSYVQVRILEVASSAALPKDELVKRVAKIGQGCGKTLVRDNVAALVREEKIVKARTVGQSQLFYAADATEALIRSSLELLKSRLLESGVSEENLRRINLGAESPACVSAPAAYVGTGTRILEALRDLQSSPGAAVTARALRARLIGVDKAEFDRAVIQLAEEQRVYVVRHDHGWGLPEAERGDLIHDGGTNLYVAVGTR